MAAATFFITKGEGYKLYDVDGNEIIDCLNNMTSLIHGHAHPKVVEAICEQVHKGTAHAAPIDIQYKLANMICDRVPSVEAIRFGNSGSEGTLFALRAAHGFTKRNKIIKVDGGYHASYVQYADYHNAFQIFYVPGSPQSDWLLAKYSGLPR